MDEIKKFEAFRHSNIQNLKKSSSLKESGIKFVEDSSRLNYSYNFSWLGRPIIQYPQDMIAIQELLWQTRPDVVVETGIAHGGSIIFTASILQLIGKGQVIGVDIDIRQHNRVEIEAHPMSQRIQMIEGSSISGETFSKVKSLIKPTDRVMVILDSNHTHDHVLNELNLYSQLVSKGCYIVVLDTSIEYMPEDFFPDRPWGRGNSPLSAAREFLKLNDNFSVDEDVDAKLVISVGLQGYLKRVR